MTLDNTTDRLMRVRLSPADVMDCLLFRFVGERRVYTRFTNVPDDARAVGLYYEPFVVPASVYVVLESASFAPVPEGQIIPELLGLTMQAFSLDNDIRDYCGARLEEAVTVAIEDLRRENARLRCGGAK